MNKKVRQDSTSEEEVENISQRCCVCIGSGFLHLDISQISQMEVETGKEAEREREKKSTCSCVRDSLLNHVS